MSRELCSESTLTADKLQSWFNSLWPQNLNVSRFVGSTVALSVCGNTVLYPLYFCKTRIQTNVGRLSGNPLKDVWLEATRTVRHYGVRGVYRGFWFSTLAVIPAILSHVAIYTSSRHQMGANSSTQQRHAANGANHCAQRSQQPTDYDLEDFDFDSESNKNWKNTSLFRTTVTSLFCGMLAESLSVLIYVPEEVIQQRIVLAPRSHSFPRVVADIYKEADAKVLDSFFRGTRAAYAQYLPSAAVWWATYESLKQLSAASGTLSFTLCGAGAGMFTGMLITPLDIVRTRIQTQQGTYGQTQVFKAMAAIIRNEGLVAGLSKGIAAKMGLLCIEGIVFADCYQFIVHFATVDSD